MSDSAAPFELDENGKVFSPVVTKRPLTVLIQTTANLIRGDIHIRPNERLKDEIDRQEQTLAVTDARVYSPARELLYQAGFMDINRQQIIWIIPLEEIVEPTPE